MMQNLLFSHYYGQRSGKGTISAKLTNFSFVLFSKFPGNTKKEDDKLYLFYLLFSPTNHLIIHANHYRLIYYSSLSYHTNRSNIKIDIIKKFICIYMYCTVSVTYFQFTTFFYMSYFV